MRILSYFLTTTKENEKNPISGASSRSIVLKKKNQTHHVNQYNSSLRSESKTAAIFVIDIRYIAVNFFPLYVIIIVFFFFRFTRIILLHFSRFRAGETATLTFTRYDCGSLTGWYIMNLSVVLTIFKFYSGCKS